MDERDWPYGMSAGPGHGGLAQWSCWLDREFQCRTDLWTDDADKVQDRTVELAIAVSVPRSAGLFLHPEVPQLWTAQS
jgi:hypothetical protein